MKSIKEQKEALLKATPGKWVRGSILGTVISDQRPVSTALTRRETGHLETEYYGGYLIAESILRPADVDFIANVRRDYADLLDWAELARKHIFLPFWGMREDNPNYSELHKLLEELPE